MQRVSSHYFLGRIPEAFPEPPPHVPSEVQNHFRRRAEVEENSRAGGLNGLLRADLRQSIRESLDTAADSPTDPAFASPMLYKHVATANTGKVSPVDSSFSISSDDDVFDDSQKRSERLEHRPMAPPLGTPLPSAEQRKYREGSYNVYLARFTELSDYYLQSSTSPEQWARQLGITDAEWAEKLNETEAQVFLESITEDENLYEAKLDFFKLLMSLYRHQAQLELRTMKAPTKQQRRPNLSTLSKSSDEDGKKISRARERVHKVANSLHLRRAKDSSCNAKTVISINYTSVSAGTQPILVPSFSSPVAYGHFTHSTILREVQENRNNIDLSCIEASTHPNIKVTKATPQSNALSQSAPSSAVSTPTRKPGDLSAGPTTQQQAQKPRVKVSRNSRIPAPQFTAGNERSSTRVHPSYPPRAITRALTSFRRNREGPATVLPQLEQVERYKDIKKRATSIPSPIDCTNDQTKQNARHAAAQKKELGRERVAARYESKLQKAREAVALKRSSNDRATLVESKRSSTGSFWSDLSLRSSRNASRAGSAKNFTRDSWKDFFFTSYSTNDDATKQQKTFSSQSIGPKETLLAVSTIPSVVEANAQNLRPHKRLHPSRLQQPLPRLPITAAQQHAVSEATRVQHLAYQHFNDSKIEPCIPCAAAASLLDVHTDTSSPLSAIVPPPEQYKHRSHLLVPVSLSRQRSWETDDDATLAGRIHAPKRSLKRTNAVRDLRSRRVEVHISTTGNKGIPVLEKPLPPNPPAMATAAAQSYWV